jgi:glycosyltransferase involved in cell wall biosynthesis
MAVSPQRGKLLIVGTHPIQYLAPVYRMLETKWDVPVNIIYASDFSVAGYFDKEFQTRFAWDIDLFTSPDRCTFLSRSAEGGATCFDEISAKGLGKAMAAAAPAAVLLTGYSPAFHRHAFFHATRLGLPILFRAETIDGSFDGDGPVRWVRNILLRSMYARCARLLPIGKRSYKHYRQLGCSDQKLVFSRYCVDTAPFRCDEAARLELRPGARAELGIFGDQIALLFSGKLYPRKRPHVLMEAVKRLPEAERSRIVLVFLGSGEQKETLRTEAVKDPAIRVSFPGFKNQTELSPYYHAADILVLPSAWETWGLVVNEALHHGVPCVVTDTVGCAPDLVHPGITGEIATGTPQGLADALMRALPLSQREGVRDRCRSVMSDYTVEKASKGIRDAFEQVVHPISTQ